MSAEELVRACAESNDRAAWDEFVHRFHKPISLSILRASYQWGAVASQVVDDLVQETYLKLCADQCRPLREFAGQHPGSIIGYLKTIAINVAHDHFKALHSQKRGPGEAAQSFDEFDPVARSTNLGNKDSVERAILLKEINACLEACSYGTDQERDRLIFWLYYQQGMTAKAIAALPTIDLTAKGVESVILRLTRFVREKIVGLRSGPEQDSRPGAKGFKAAESY